MYIPISLSSTSSSNLDVITTQQSLVPRDRIVTAYHRGDFKPYETFLKQIERLGFQPIRNSKGNCL